jgi:hypothetical protein
MIVEEFTRAFIAKNTLVRLWYKLPISEGAGYNEVIGIDKPMMEHKLLNSEYKTRTVIEITDIYYDKSPYVEAINLVISK